MQVYKTQFTLTREYLAECFDQSLPYGKNARTNYYFPLLLFVAGVGLLGFTQQPKVVGSMLIALAALELVHIKFRRAWWLTRQMWGRSANCDVALTLDEQGVTTQTLYTQVQINWDDVARVIDTELGLILVTQSGAQHYLSKAVLPEQLVSFVVSKGMM